MLFPVDLYGDDDLDLSTQLAINIDAQTESTHDTPLTLCCSGGHDELVQVLLARGADLEHRDKKGLSHFLCAHMYAQLYSLIQAVHHLYWLLVLAMH